MSKPFKYRLSLARLESNEAFLAVIESSADIDGNIRQLARGISRVFQKEVLIEKESTQVVVVKREDQ